MYRRILTTLVAVLAFCFASRSSSADVIKIVVDDTIHPYITELLGNAIHEAERTHAEALLIELRTPGGLVSSTEEIVQEILASPVPIIIYVTPAGATAASAGFYILEAADIAAMAPGTNTGAAHPVLEGATMDPVMKEKMENHLASFLRGYGEKRGRNLEVGEKVVRESKSFTADEALKQHLIDYVATSEDDLLHQIDGKTITRFDASKLTLHLTGKPIREYNMTLREQILSRLMNPNFAFLLFAVGMMALWAEFNHPGAVIPGVVGFVFILLALFAFHILPTRYAALVLILGAFILFALEAKFQTHGVLTVGGIAIMVLGALLLVDGPIPEMRVRWVTALSVSIPLGLITVFLMTIALRARRNKVVMGPQGLIGEIGIVSAPLTPSGKVLLDGALWNAVASSSVDVGQNVVVRGVENLTLHVEPAASGSVKNG